MKSVSSLSIGVLLFYQFSIPAFAQADAEVPSALFGISIGAVFEEDILSREITGLNVVRVTKTGKADRYGYLIFFEPIDVDSIYPYIEEERLEGGFIDSSGDPFETSFHLLALPVLPRGAENIESIEELEAISPRHLEVGHVAWSDTLGAGSRGSPTSRSVRYDWARTVCLIMKGYIEIQPQVVDTPEEQLYQCTFVGDTLELAVSSGDQRSIHLKYRDEVLLQKEAAIETLLSRIQ